MGCCAEGATMDRDELLAEKWKGADGVDCG